MSGRLVNVRLDEKRLQMARRLRVAGVPLADVVREAIDRRYEQMIASSGSRNVIAIATMNQIYEQCPDPPDLPARGYDVHNRREAKEAISRKLQGKRR